MIGGVIGGAIIGMISGTISDMIGGAASCSRAVRVQCVILVDQIIKKRLLISAQGCIYDGTVDVIRAVLRHCHGRCTP